MLRRKFLHNLLKLFGFKIHYFMFEEEDNYKFYLAHFNKTEDATPDFTFSMNINDTKFFDNYSEIKEAYDTIATYYSYKLLASYFKFIDVHRKISYTAFKKYNKYSSKFYIDFYVFSKPKRIDIGKTEDDN